MEIKPVFQARQKHILKTRLIPKLIGRVKLAEFIQLPEKEFSRFIKEVEVNPLFKKLVYPKKREQKIVSYRRLHHADFSPQFCELKEEIIREKSSFDIQPLLSNRKEIIQIIKRLGMDKFKHYFLYNESKMTEEEIAELCRLKIEEVKSINALVDELSIHSEFYYPSQIRPAEGASYTKIASIEKRNGEGLVVAYFSPHLARGRYLINYELLERLKRKSIFSQEQMGQIDKLLKQLEIINFRKATIHRVIQNIIERQADFLESGEPDKLVPVSQKEVADTVGVSPSLLCRAISGRSVDTPRGEEIPLKNFFPSKKDARKNLIREIIRTEKRPYKDGEVKDLLKKRYKVDVSRHLVSICRNELRIPSARRREG